MCLFITNTPGRLCAARLPKLWPQNQHSTQGGGQHPEEGEQGGQVDKGFRKRRHGRRGQLTQSRHTLISCILHNHPAMLSLFHVGFFHLENNREGKTEVKKPHISHTPGTFVAPVLLLTKASDLSRNLCHAHGNAPQPVHGLMAQPQGSSGRRAIPELSIHGQAHWPFLPLHTLDLLTQAHVGNTLESHAYRHLAAGPPH